MDKNISFIKFNPHTKKGELLLPGLVGCYRAVFGDEPWNEWKKCPVCEDKWGLNEKDKLVAINFTHCGQSVVDFWPSCTVKSDIYEELSPDSSCWLALDGSRVIGFCWGYPVKPIDLEKKLKLPEVANQIKSSFGNIAFVGYQDEIGVLKEYRGQKIAKKMFMLRLKDFLSMGIEVGVVRTMSNPPSTAYGWFKKTGYDVIVEYNDADRRVILARTLRDLAL